jgi:hypothetical protein
VNSCSDYYEKSNDTTINTVDISIQNHSEQATASQEPSQPSQPSPKPILLSNDDTVKPVKEGKKISTELPPSTIDGKFRCFYCQNTSSQDNLERIKHIDIEHPGRLHHN